MSIPETLEDTEIISKHSSQVAGLWAASAMQVWVRKLPSLHLLAHERYLGIAGRTSFRLSVSLFKHCRNEADFWGELCKWACLVQLPERQIPSSPPPPPHPSPHHTLYQPGQSESSPQLFIALEARGQNKGAGISRSLALCLPHSPTGGKLSSSEWGPAGLRPPHIAGPAVSWLLAAFLRGGR
jgi:hypothetical protein